MPQPNLDKVTYEFKTERERVVVEVDVGNLNDGSWAARVNGEPTRLNGGGMEYPTADYVAEQLVNTRQPAATEPPPGE